VLSTDKYKACYSFRYITEGKRGGVCEETEANSCLMLKIQAHSWITPRDKNWC